MHNYKSGDKVICNGYPGTVIYQYLPGMWEVRMPRGVVVVPESAMMPQLDVI